MDNDPLAREQEFRRQIEQAAQAKRAARLRRSRPWMGGAEPIAGFLVNRLWLPVLLLVILIFGGFFFVGLVMMLYARLFSSPVPQIKGQYTPPSLGPMASALPPHTHVPMHDIQQQRAKTNELTQPSSVTEHTTKLLDQ